MKRPAEHAALAQPATRPRSEGCLGPSDILDLGILGLTALQPMSAASLAAHLHHLGRPLFAPTTEVVAGRIAGLMERGWVEERLVCRKAVLGPTAAGQILLRQLLRQPLGNEPTVQRDTLLLLKICLLDLIDAADRRDALRELAQRRRVELAAAQAAIATWRAGGHYARLLLRRQVEWINADLAWLEMLAAGAPHAAISRRSARRL